MTEYSADDILELINGRENKDVDYKISIDISGKKAKNLAIDAISFANAKGGLIIVGIAIVIGCAIIGVAIVLAKR